MVTIKKLWFDAGRVWITTSDGEILSRPLEAFPALKEATDEQRSAYAIGRFGDDVRWEEIDEDIHISSFYETTEPDLNNDVALLLSRFPQIQISDVAKMMGISPVLMSRYVYGMKRPSEETLEQIKDSVNRLVSSHHHVRFNKTVKNVSSAFSVNSKL